MTAIMLTGSLCLLYLLVIRFLDLNEREPMWAVLLLFGLGFLVSGILGLVVPRSELIFSALRGATLQEGAKFAAICLGLAVLWITGRVRGWSELHGPMDGIVYGAAGGLGFAVGETLVRELFLASTTGGLPSSAPFAVAWGSALSGLSHGMLGAISGVALVTGIGKGVPGRIAWSAGGLGAAIGTSFLLQTFAYGDVFGGTIALVKAWIALLVPLATVVIVGAYAVSREKKTILVELSGELGSGLVSQDEIDLLGATLRRQTVYWGAFIRGDFARLALLRGVHTRLVQLAFIKQRSRLASDPGARESAAGEADRLRASLRTLQEREGTHLAGATEGGGRV